MEDISARIVANADEIVRLHKRIYETVRYRSRSREDRSEWNKACEEFHRRYPELIFPGGIKHWVAFLHREPQEMDSAIAFLEADPWFFRSGYFKQIIWERLKRATLGPEQISCLEKVAECYLNKQVQREFWSMVRFFRFRGTESFWRRIAVLASSRHGGTAIKANWMMLARHNEPVRNWISRELLRPSYKPGYMPNLWFE